MGAMLPKPEQSQFRKIDVLREGVTVGREQDSMANNVVVTSKYNAVTFMPRSLFEQFRRIANIYFLVISILMIIGTYTTLFTSPLTPWSTLLPLFLVLLVTMVKDGVEDLKRHRSDRRVNNTKALALDIHNRGSFVDVHWKDVKVGMIMKVVDREEMPADLVLLTSSEAGGIGYIETANIDGETNLKIRTSAPTRPGQPPGPAWTSVEELHGVPMEMEYEAPNPRIHFFTGTLNVGSRGASSGADNGESGRAISAPVEAPVDQSNLLLRGSRLRNTKWVLGVVAYTGKESKIAQNARSVPSKQSNLDKVTNKIMFVVFTCMVLVTTVSLVGYLIFSAQNDDQLYYLCDNYEDAPVPLFRDNCEDSDSSSDAGQWFTFLILFNNFVPISLYVTLEMVNFIQASFIDQDLQMYDEAQDTPAQARSANMAGDLGQVEYVFSDKTGTLTQNLMKFKRCSVGGSIFGEVGQDAKDLMTPQQLSHVVDAPPLPVLAETVAKANAGAVSLEFALCLALNHTVMLETDPKTGEKRMQAESPDEEALVDGAKMLGVEFVNRSPGKVELEIAGRGRQAYKLMVTVPFDSTRKRMSVVVQAPDDSYVLYCKGADNIMMERAGKYIETDKAAVTSHLGVFSNDGLRTLLLGKRDMSKEFFDEWFSKYREASIATNDRAEKIAEVAKEVEGDLEILGVTAIEDKLQDDVPGTIADLGKAGVKLWVLTGDKMETAINIGYSCRLLEPEMTLIKLKEKEGDPKSVCNQLRALMLHFNKLVEDDGLVKRLWGTIKSNNPVGLVRRTVLRRTGGGGGDSGRVSPGVEDDRVVSLPEPLLEQPEGAPPLSELSAESLALVVDGPSLVHVLGNPEAERMLLALGSMCKSVVACRVSPAQKRLIVRLVKRGVVPTPVTLAIGDGANDVGMIQEAQIGVGISGKEGRQAVNNADFAIAQFRFLKRLMLVHGHWDYRRICKVILYSFYKNFVLVFVLFYFSFYAGFSGQSLFESMVYSGYNFFLAMPILLVGLFDKDVKAETALECHKLYAIGRLGMDLNIRVMTKWVCQAILDSLVIYFMPLTAYQNPVTVWAHRGYGDGLYVFGTTVYACLVISMMLKVFNLTSTWNWQSWFFLLGSLALFFGFIALYSLLVSWAYSYYYVAFQLMSRATFWILIIQVPCVTWAIDTLIRTVEHMFFPNVGNHASEFDRGFTSESGRQRRQDLKDRVREQEFESESSGRVREIAGPRRDMAGRQKWKMGPEEMRALNETVDQRELDSMGISDGAEFRRQSSSFAFDHVTADFGPGASAAREELRSLVAEEGPERVRSTRVRSLTRWDSSALSTLDLESQRQRSERELQGSGREASRSRMSSFSASQDSAAGSTLGGTRQHQSSEREAPGSDHTASSSSTRGFGASQDSAAGSMFGGTQWGRGVAESKGEDI